MVRLVLLEHAASHLSPVSSFIPLAIGLFITASVLVALCAHHSPRPDPPKNHHHRHETKKQSTSRSHAAAPKSSPLSSPKRLMTSLSDKTIPFMMSKKKDSCSHGHEQNKAENDGKVEEGGFGEGGLWQKTILMGERCRPPEFSGVIYYDSRGNQVAEVPRSPRSSPLSNLSFPVIQDAN